MVGIIDRRSWTVLLAILIVLSWVALWLWGQTASAQYLDHATVGHLLEGHVGGRAVVLFSAAWTLMVVAMMLPTTLPLVNLFQGMVGDRPYAPRLMLLLVAGYLTIWGAFGLVAHFSVGSLQWVMQQFQVSFSGYKMALLGIAGVYQFTPLKYHCLTKCRSPLSFILGRWHGANERLESFRIGFDHGVYCIGCCWSLMLLMFLFGGASILWMIALGTVMAVEKNVSWGRSLSKPLGIALLIAVPLVRWLPTSW
jgi:predicted metal-binding membrane protein